jgi:hypothetical protein
MRILSLLFMLSAVAAQGQRIRFVPLLAGEPLVLDQPCRLSDGTALTITQFRFYAGQFVCWQSGKAIAEEKTYHLIDASDSASLDVTLDTPSRVAPDSITFLLGVDSLTNVSGAFGGDLDPVKGMYWTWNSGYINLKLEGTSPVSPYASHQFELHLGGYLPPHATAQRLSLPVHDAGRMSVPVDVAPLLVAANVRTRCNVMRPGERAVQLSRVAATLFSTHAAP